MAHTDRPFIPLNIAVLTVSDTRSFENDTSGGINYREVAGSVSLPENRQGG